MAKVDNFKPASVYKRIRKACKCLSTGIFAIDMAISEIDDEGFAGIRERDVLELCGPNNSLKTAVSLSMVKTTLDRFPGKKVAAILSEACDPDRLDDMGIDIERLLIYQLVDEDGNYNPLVTAEEACDGLLHIVRDSDIALALIDSVAALVPKGLEFDGTKEREFGKATVALLAKVMNEFIVKFKNHSASAPLCMVNHYKEQINTGFSFIGEDKSKLQTPGGRGSEFLSDVRILCNSSVILDKNPHSVIGVRQGDYYECKWTLFKNKYCPSKIHRTVKSTFKPGEGFNNTEILLDWGELFTVKGHKEDEYYSKLSNPIIKRGSWVTCNGIKKQGSDKLAKELDENHPNLVDKLKKEMYKLEGDFFMDRKPSLEDLISQ